MITTFITTTTTITIKAVVLTTNAHDYYKLLRRSYEWYDYCDSCDYQDYYA